MTKLEEVGEAICNEAFEKLGAPKCYHLNKALYDDVAKAALEVLKEPSDLMVAVVEELDKEAAEKNLAEGGPGQGLYAGEIYTAMIKSALEE